MSVQSKAPFNGASGIDNPVQTLQPDPAAGNGQAPRQAVGHTREEAWAFLNSPREQADFQAFLHAAHAVGPDKLPKFPALAASCDAMLNPDDPEGAQRLIKLADNVSNSPILLQTMTNFWQGKKGDADGDTAAIMNRPTRVFNDISDSMPQVDETFHDHSSFLGGLHPGGQNFLQQFADLMQNIFGDAIHNDIVPLWDSLPIIGLGPTIAGETGTTPYNHTPKV